MIRPPEVLVLGIKPQMLDDAAANLRTMVGPTTLTVSILAGKTIGDLRSRIPGLGAVVRAMPNLPASVQRGVTASCAERRDHARTARARAYAAVRRRPGRVGGRRAPDRRRHGGVGLRPRLRLLPHRVPGRAGAAAGLPPDLAERLARATVEGAGELLHRSDLAPGTLRENVTSPGGTTAAALAVLMAPEGMEPLIRDAVLAARRRAEELSG